MAKRKRKPSSTQRNPQVVAAAKIAKARGLLSKQVKLHGGKYVSPAVASKILNQLRGALENNYRAVKVPRSVAVKAKAQGFLTVSNRVVVPPDARFIKRLRQGYLSGVQAVRGAMLESVVLPYDIFDMRALVEKLQEDEHFLDDLKLPDEQFAFRFYGHMSYRTFLTQGDFLKYLTHYRSIFDPAGDLRAENMVETFQNLQLLRLNPNAGGMNNIPSREDRERAARGRKKFATDRKERSGTRPYKERVHPTKLKQIRMNDALKAQQRRAAMTGAKLEAYREASKARTKAYRMRLKKDN